MKSLAPRFESSPALRLAGTGKTYGPIQVLDGFDLSVGCGEVVALMGANGAGKSTLARIASGVVQPDKGRIFVAGREVSLASPRAAREAGIVIVHQSTDHLGVPGLSVAENLVLDGLCAGGIGVFVHKRKIHQKAQAVAARIGLDIPLNGEFGELVAVMRNHTVACLPDLHTADPSSLLAAIGAAEASEAGEKGEFVT